MDKKPTLKYDCFDCFGEHGVYSGCIKVSLIATYDD